MATIGNACFRFATLVLECLQKMIQQRATNPDVGDFCVFFSSSGPWQVISLQDPTRLPAWMQDEVMVAENLSDTTERRKDWYHFYASGGLPSLQRASLTQADVMELHFNRRAAWYCRVRISRMLFFWANVILKMMQKGSIPFESDTSFEQGASCSALFLVLLACFLS